MEKAHEITWPCIDKGVKKTYNKEMILTGEKLRELRESHDMTIEELAVKASYSWVHLQKMEKGKRPISKRFHDRLKEWGWIK